MNKSCLKYFKTSFVEDPFQWADFGIYLHCCEKKMVIDLHNKKKRKRKKP